MTIAEISTIYLHVTRSCNLGCVYCYLDAGEAMDEEMTLEDLKTLLEEIVVLEPSKLVFTGGEPLIRSDLFEAVKIFRQAQLNNYTILCLATNGTLIDKPVAARIAKSFDEVRVSLDGPEEINDRLRGVGVYRKAMKAVSHLKSVGMIPGISVTVSSFNLENLKDFLSFLLDEAGLTKYHLSTLHPIGGGARYPEMRVSWRKVQLTVADYWRSRFGEPVNLKPVENYTLSGCGRCAVGNHINIYPDGSVYPCHVLSLPRFNIGNVKHARLSDIIHGSELLKSLRNLDCREMASLDKYARSLLENTICLGEVYRDAPELFIGL